MERAIISIPMQNVILTGNIAGGKITGGAHRRGVRADADATVVAGSNFPRFLSMPSRFSGL